MSDLAKPLFVVRIARGLVTHWGDEPLLTVEQAQECRKAILDHTGEDGQIERVSFHMRLRDPNWCKRP